MSEKKQTREIGKGGPGPGRPKGVPNRTTTLIKDAIIAAAQAAGGDEGMAGYLQQQAKDNPGPFLALLGKVLPMQLANYGGGELKVTVTIDDG